MILIVGGDQSEKLASYSHPGKRVTSLTQHPDVPGWESAPVEALGGWELRVQNPLASLEVATEGPVPGACCSPSPSSASLVQCLVKSREGTLGGRKAEGNLREPFGLIPRAVTRSPPLGSGIQSRLSRVPSAPLPPGLILAHWGAARVAQQLLVRGPCQLCWEAERARLRGRVARWSHR